MPSAKHRVVSFLTRSPEGSASSNQFKPNKQNCGRLVDFNLSSRAPTFPDSRPGHHAWGRFGRPYLDEDLAFLKRFY